MRKAWVRKVDPVGLHGFKQGDLTLDGLEPGLNLVLARNATGKSTLAKAIGLLFDPAKCEREHIILCVIDGRDGERHVQARRKGGRYPGFPGEYDQYQLDLLRLIEGFKGQSPLDAEIGDGMRFETAPPVGMQRLSEVTAAKEARQRLVEARREKAGVAEVEDRLPHLQAQVDEAQKGKRFAEALEALEQRGHTEERLAQLRAEMQSLIQKAPGLDLQKSDSANLGKTLLESLKKALARYVEAERKLKQARPDGHRPESSLSLTVRNTLEGLVEQLARVEAEINRAERQRGEELAKAAASRDQALRLLGSEGPEDLPKPNTADFEALIAAASQADASRLSRLQADAFQSMREDWGKKQGDADPNLERKLQRLVSWFAAEPSQARDSRVLWLTVVAILGAFIEVAASSIVFAVAIAVLVAIVAVVIFFRRPSHSGRPDIAELLDEPVTAASAAGLIESLSRQKALAEVGKELEAKAKISPPEFSWEPLAASLRLKCQNPYALAPLATSLSAYHGASISAVEAGGRLSQLQSEAEEARIAIRRIFEEFDFPVVSGQEIPAARAFKSWFDYDDDLSRAEKEAFMAEGSLKVFLTENGILESADLEDAVAELNRRSQSAQKYQITLREVENLEFSISQQAPDAEAIRMAFGEGPVEPAQLQELRKRYEAEASELTARQQALSDAKAKVQAAERAAIPEREHAYEAALSKVEVKFEQLVRQAVRARIGKEIQERLRTTELPEVVRRASGYLESFTEGRFRLEIGTDRSEGLGMLVVRDKNRQLQDFAQLSTGTKVHAVIAVRLAVIRSQEDKAAERTGATIRFPLIADEALAVSDPECSQEIAHTLASIAEERQVIVFTNHPQDIQLFKRFDKNVNVLTLGEGSPEALPIPIKRSRKAEAEIAAPAGLPQLGLDI